MGVCMCMLVRAHVSVYVFIDKYSVYKFYIIAAL